VHTKAGKLGMAMVLFVVVVAIFGPLAAPHSVNQPVGLGLPGAGPTSASPLGTDYIGRDVLSRTLAGGRGVLVLGLAATVLTYLFAISVGLVAGYSRSIADPLLMRGVDVLMAFPPLLLLLVLITGAGTAVTTVVFGVALVLFPGASRIIRAATQEVSVKGFIEAAVARGEPARTIILREVFPNIVQVVLADLGIRLSAAVVLVASLDFLGVGLPQSDNWAVMITQNRVIIPTNPWAVLAPAFMLGLFTVGVNLTADAYARCIGRSADS
jgi:peptide/nickel transport system permease protein